MYYKGKQCKGYCVTEQIFPPDYVNYIWSTTAYRNVKQFIDCFKKFDNKNVNSALKLTC
jgi:hypothetical protein